MTGRGAGSPQSREKLFTPEASDEGNATIKDHDQKFTLRLLAKLAEKENVTLLCHCAEDATESVIGFCRRS